VSAIDDTSAARVAAGAPTGRPTSYGSVAAALASVVDRAVAAARERGPSDRHLLAIGIYGPEGSGKSRLMQAVREALPAEAYLSIPVNPRTVRETDSLYGLFYDRVLDQMAPRFLGIRSRPALKAMLWISNHPWIYGLSVLFGLFPLVLMLDASLSWQMFDDVYHAWRTAQPGEEMRAVRYIMEWYPVGLLAQAAPVVAAALPIAFKLAPPLLGHISARFGVAAAAGSPGNLQALYGGLVATTKPGPRTLVFFVDGIDHCTPARVAEVVESIRCLTHAGCVVFLACDDDYVSAALGAWFKEIAARHRDGAEYGRGLLGKAVEMSLRTPRIEPTEHGAKLDETRIAGIVEETAQTFVRPLGLDARDADRLIAAIRLQLDIAGFGSEAEARRLAAAVFIEALDPAWLDAHALNREPPIGSALALHRDLAKCLEEAIGRNEAELRRIYRRLGRRPRWPTTTSTAA